jgi:hypothetical protein
MCVMSVEQLEIERIDSGVEHWIPRAKGSEPLRAHGFGGEARANGVVGHLLITYLPVRPSLG